MLQCGFELNDLPMSKFSIGITSYPAFSGRDSFKNRKIAACMSGAGPIPPGTYYIVERKSGGFISRLYDHFGQRANWFSLYANDSNIDDELFCDSVKRGNFRLHPKIGHGISKGCVTIDSQADFSIIRARLLSSIKFMIPGTELLAYGRLVVR